MTDFTNLTAANLARWRAMRVNPSLEQSIDTVAQKLIRGKNRYQPISAKTGVPWAVIAVIHEREASCDWGANIAQGNPWDKVSTDVPKGRGPFACFEDAAFDALMNCAPFAGKWSDWSMGGALTLLEQYNGLGYASGPRDLQGNRYPPQPSPYIWASTDQYVSGKYVADHDYRPSVVDPQLGCAALLARLFVADASANFDTGSGAAPPPQVQSPPDDQASPPATSAGEPHDTKWLQESLNKCGADPKLDVDGIYGPLTRAAVTAFQQQAGIAVDGVTGPQTFGALEAKLVAGAS